MENEGDREEGKETMKTKEILGRNVGRGNEGDRD